ncbi:hypothetical protein BLNAU_20315 [Blattamonas nauphoetae]|uniref:Uncharacterized protein n=1 Tax=Blattamonas nauphoetae TaxID=2049346 RepID=A0ABQ9WZA3_9EUKA|nr:hypothetical protein BLNAU_20315 [Blattamonas nauphoetae]
MCSFCPNLAVADVQASDLIPVIPALTSIDPSFTYFDGTTQMPADVLYRLEGGTGTIMKELGLTCEGWMLDEVKGKAWMLLMTYFRVTWMGEEMKR